MGPPSAIPDWPRLKGLPNLKTLDLGSTKVTDAGLAKLKPLANLSTLVLTSTAVTDAGLATSGSRRTHRASN